MTLYLLPVKIQNMKNTSTVTVTATRINAIANWIIEYHEAIRKQMRDAIIELEMQPTTFSEWIDGRKSFRAAKTREEAEERISKRERNNTRMFGCPWQHSGNGDDYFARQLLAAAELARDGVMNLSIEDADRIRGWERLQDADKYPVKMVS